MTRLRSFVSRLGTHAQDLLGSPMDLPPAAGEFVRGINLGGESLQIQGERWQSHEEALAAGLLVPQARSARTEITPHPYAEPGVRQMLNSVVFRQETLDISLPLDPGAYGLYLWIMENYRSHWHSLAFSFDGHLHDRPLGDLALGAWRREGPFALQAAEGRLRMQLATGSPEVDAHLMGLSIHRTVRAG